MIAILEVVPDDVNKVSEVAGPGRKMVNTVKLLQPIFDEWIFPSLSFGRVHFQF